MSPVQHLRLPGPTLRHDLLLASGYLAAFLVLDWVSFIHPFQGLNITPWNPQPALAVALLVRRPRWLWLVWAGLALADILVRGAPDAWLPSLAASAAMAFTYAAIARATQLKLDRSLALGTRRDLYWFTLIAVAGALLAGAVYVGTVAASIGSPRMIAEAIGRYWVGDAVGLVVTMPVLLMLMDPVRRASLRATLRRADLWLAAAIIVFVVLVMFGLDQGDYFRFSYVLLLPVVWASARLGLPGAVLVSAVTQSSLIVAIRTGSNPDLTVFELQMLMAAITMTALMLGVTVDERERATAELKGSLRLAAAGQMAAALAHELSQPLTALNNYAEASNALGSRTDVADAERVRLQAEISSRMAADAVRASDVVKRLRDFFRTGSTQLRRIEIAPLLHEAIAATARRAEALHIDVACQCADGGAGVLMDPIQIAVVLRNLLTNALDAVATLEGVRRVDLLATRQHDAVLVEVRDSGPGPSAVSLHSLFEPGTSDKAGGMGVGLSICRAIIEAHGGALWALPGACGHFCFTLPLDPTPEPGKKHAP